MKPPSTAKVLLCDAILLQLLSFHLHLSCAQAQVLYSPIAAVPARWPNRADVGKISFPDGDQVRPVLVQPKTSVSGMNFACGFFCSGNCTSFLFAVYMDIRGNQSNLESSRMVWAANRARPVKENATLELNSAGDLVLSDADGIKVWSSGTAGKSVAGMNITESGNLVLFGGAQNQTLFWESFSSPTDSLVPGQKLPLGQKLTANISSDSSSEGLYFLQVSSTGLIAYVNSTPPQRYASSEQSVDDLFNSKNGFIGRRPYRDQKSPTPQFLRLDSDGGLRIYSWNSNKEWAVRDIFNPERLPCFSPTACGRYAICTVKEQCVCPAPPAGNLFQFEENWNPEAGCREITPLSCSGPHNHSFLQLDDVSYFGYIMYQQVDIDRVDRSSCREACERNCSCRAAFFWYVANVSDGACLFTSEVFSLKKIEPEEVNYNSTAFLKIQIPLVNGSVAGGENGGGTATGVIVGAALAGLFSLLVLSGGGIFIAKKRAAAIRRKKDEEEGDNDLEHVAGMPRRFSLGELRAATQDFSKKLGQGGFGSVFEGTIDGQLVAVKRLDGVAEGRKQFLAEVQTIGKVHHFHLVKLVGYCAERSTKLLVYEFMPNSSLDHWIFSEEKRPSLGWQARRRIILGIAKALAYLHEECSQKIAHLDIKPQNILLDQELEPKVADFGLAKLIDRDQTQVETQMRGTLGYLAPEWLSSMITEKADVYSYGVVVLEIVCGRKNIDRYLPEEEALLVDLARRKSRTGELGDLVDKSLDCAKEESEEATRILQLGLWCLLQDYKKRPSMSTVAKLLEGTVAMEASHEDGPPDLRALLDSGGDETSGSAPLLVSVLSGPR